MFGKPRKHLEIASHVCRQRQSRVFPAEAPDMEPRHREVGADVLHKRSPILATAGAAPPAPTRLEPCSLCPAPVQRGSCRAPIYRTRGRALSAKFLARVDRLLLLPLAPSRPPFVSHHHSAPDRVIFPGEFRLAARWARPAVVMAPFAELIGIADELASLSIRFPQFVSVHPAEQGVRSDDVGHRCTVRSRTEYPGNKLV